MTNSSKSNTKLITQASICGLTAVGTLASWCLHQYFASPSSPHDIKNSTMLSLLPGTLATGFVMQMLGSGLNGLSSRLSSVKPEAETVITTVAAKASGIFGWFFDTVANPAAFYPLNAEVHGALLYKVILPFSKYLEDGSIFERFENYVACDTTKKSKEAKASKEEFSMKTALQNIGNALATIAAEGMLKGFFPTTEFSNATLASIFGDMCFGDKIKIEPTLGNLIFNMLNEKFGPDSPALQVKGTLGTYGPTPFICTELIVSAVSLMKEKILNNQSVIDRLCEKFGPITDDAIDECNDLSLTLDPIVVETY